MWQKMQRVPSRFLAISIILVLVTLLYLARRYNTSTVIHDPDFKETKETMWTSAIEMTEDRREDSPLWSSIDELSPDLSKTTQDSDFYGVMFDAGSTGSRVHVFHFEESPPGIPPVLLREVYNFTKLPLAQYADNPQEGAASLKGLLHVALESIPSRQWTSTPIALKATAGLRLIPKDKANSLLDAVYKLFEESPFSVVTRESSVSIMDGTDEGIFMWVTVNFLNGALTNGSSETVGTLDMGGGSTQVTFRPKQEETLNNPLHQEFIKEHPFLRHEYKLYTRSYLSLGLRAARLEILKWEKENPIFIGSSLVEDSAAEKYFTSCLPPSLSGSWELGGNTYVAMSSNVHSDHLYKNCLSVVKAFVEDTVTAPMEMENQSFYALSYFWEKPAENSLIDWEEGGVLLVKDYKHAAIDICGSQASSVDKPFHCMDMVYLSTVLAHGYKFRDDVPLIMTNKMKGFEVSWALGATLDLLRTHWIHLRKL